MKERKLLGLALAMWFLRPNKVVINPLFVSLSVLGALFLTLAIASVVHEKGQHSTLIASALNSSELSVWLQL